MSDEQTTIAQLRATMAQFVAEREWNQFHAPKNLAISIAIETAELMEHFQWISVQASRRDQLSTESVQAIGEEIADVFCYLLALVNELDLDLSETFAAKFEKTRKKYPVEKFRGRFGRGDSDSAPP